MFCQKSLHGSCRIGRCIVVMKLPVTTCPQLWPFSSYCISQPAKDFIIVLLSYCLAWRSVLMFDSTYMIKKKSTWPRRCSALAAPSLDVETQATSTGKTGLLFQGHSHRPMTHLQLWPFGEIWVFVSGFKQVLVNFRMKFLLLLWQELLNRFCHHMFLAKIICQNLLNTSPWNHQCFL